MGNVHRSDPAKRDLLDIWHYIAMDSLSAADSVIDRISTAIESLGPYPRSGKLVPQYGKNLRRILAGKYLIFYRILKIGDVNVVRVLHGARNLKRIFRKRRKR